MKPLFHLLVVSLACLPAISQAKEKNRFNLSEKPEKPRFEVTEKKWPEKVGEADICLWHDDRQAAISLGVDDNFGTEIDWWKEQAANYDFKVTWFVITGRVDANRATGYWKQFRELNELGHGVESHTVTHLHMEDPGWGTPEWNYAESAKAKAGAVPAPEDAAAAAPAKDPAMVAKGIEWEYAESKVELDKNVEGRTASALAYPGGGNTKYNDRNIAAKVFRVARGAGARPNPANQTDYINTNAMSSWHFGDQTFGWSNVNNILDKSLYRGLYYRGWAVIFAHGVSANPDLFAKTFEYLKQHREDLWIGLFTDVAKYGQERDTAELKVESAGPGKITFLLEDEMDDSYFNYPLTVKVRIPNEWKQVSAIQGGKPAEAKVIEHDGAAYALVQAVPDAGQVSLTAKGS